jgi:toxin-antitoxin system PIN domain toxin
MLLCDVNVLVYAHREDAENHARYRAWLEAMLASDAAYAYSELVLSGFLRIVTHPKIFREPTPLEAALAFAAEVRDRPNAVVVAPGPRHWGIFTRYCRECGVKGGLVSDAYYAALALESGSVWITTDRDYARFPGLSWRHPLAGADPAGGPGGGPRDRERRAGSP